MTQKTRLVGVLVVLWCLGFAAVNVAFELTGHFDHGRLAAISTGISIMNWVAAGLKILGAVIAALATVPAQRLVRSETLTVLLWGCFATVATYVAGSLVEAVSFATGLAGEPGDLSPRNLAYVLFFLAAATGFGVLAVSYSRGHGSPRRLAAWGLLGAPVVLGGLLVLLPAVLTAAGLLSTA
jgi:hypothetical protein